MKQWLALGAVWAVFCLPLSPLAAYYFKVNATWPGPIVMHLQLGTSSGTLMDGCTSWGQCAEHALSFWSQHLHQPVEFRVVRNSTSPIRDNDGVNNVFWDDDVYGQPFGSETVATTLFRWSGSQIREADVILNQTRRFNSYRGPLRSDPIDFRRVITHEFGHVLGLDHPDDGGQSVVALMNGVIGNIETPQGDDVNGIAALYGPNAPPGPAPGLAPSPSPVQIEFPPRNESLAFRNELEAVYRDTLRRAVTSSFVDMVGTVVWTQEYLRYRVNQCGHSDAVTRVFMQIDGLGIQPICGSSTSVEFPPRNEPFDFRTQLEAKYRDSLRREPTGTFVDIVGDIVWTQEYLRYRVSRCTHGEAVNRVLVQINGGGVLPGC